MLTQFSFPCTSLPLLPTTPLRFLTLFHLSLSGLFYLHSKNSFHLRQTKCSIAFPSVAMKMRVKERNIQWQKERESESERGRKREKVEHSHWHVWGPSDVCLKFCYLDGGVCRFNLEGLCTPFLHLTFTQSDKLNVCSTMLSMTGEVTPRFSM